VTEVFNIQHESDLSEYTSTVTDGGDLSQSAGAALANTAGGMQAVLNDTTAIYGEKTFDQLTSTSYRYRHYVDPNGLTMGTADQFFMCQITRSGNQRSATRLSYSPGTYFVSAHTINDAAAGEATNNYPITDAEHYVEVLVEYASGSAASDARLTLWIDDVQKQQVTGLDIYNLSKPDAGRLGAMGVDATTSGTFFLDEFVLRDDGTYIGAVGTGTVPADISVQRWEGVQVNGIVEQDVSLTVGRRLGVQVSATSVGSAASTTSTGQTVTRYELRVRGSNGSEVARLGVGQPDPSGYHVGPFQYQKQVNAAGGLIVRFSGNHPVLDELEENGQIEVWRNVDGRGWYRDFLGLWLNDYDYVYRDALEFTGYAPGPLEILNWSVVAWPAGSANRAAYSAQAAETVAKSIVTNNLVVASAGTANGRDLDWTGPFTITVEADSARGNTISKSAARAQVLETLQEIAEIGGGDFDLIRDSTDPTSFELRWYNGQRGRDRTDTITLAVERENMTNVVYRRRDSQITTAVVVGGKGEEKNRDIVVRTSADDGATRHRESFKAASFADKGDTAELQSDGDQYLEEHGRQEEFTFDVLQTQATRYGVDYTVNGRMGDLVTVVRPHDGTTQTHKIVSALVSVASDGSEQISIRTEQQ